MEVCFDRPAKASECLRVSVGDAKISSSNTEPFGEGKTYGEKARFSFRARSIVGEKGGTYWGPSGLHRFGASSFAAASIQAQG